MKETIMVSNLMRALQLFFLVLVTFLYPIPGQSNTSNDERRPFVKGGIEDKPFITSMARSRIGGYAEIDWRWQRIDGFTEELGFEMKRFNLFTYAPITDRLRVATELEFEEGGEEIKIETAQIDFELHPSIIFRGGIILAPLGRFNLAHDSPANDLTNRPLVSTEIIPTALSETGMGFYGAFFANQQMRFTYELYAVNGFNDGVIGGDPAGTRIPAGKGNFKDNNQQPALVGRIAASPEPSWEIGLSMHTGAYNKWEIEGLEIDDKRSLTIFALDGNFSWKRIEILGEYANASIDVPKESRDIFQESQQGFYLQTNAHFGHGWITEIPNSLFTVVTRYEFVDFDSDGPGDNHKRVTLGLNFRPAEDSVFKLDYQRGALNDPFNIEGKAAALIFSVATYF